VGKSSRGIGSSDQRYCITPQSTGGIIEPDALARRQAEADTLQRLFSPLKHDAPKEQKTARRNYLASLLQDGGGYDGFLGDSVLVLECYSDWIKSNYVVWPFPGARLDQPYWVIHDFKRCEYLAEFFELEQDVGRKPVSDLPTFGS
jgi:hypothetical protein